MHVLMLTEFFQKYLRNAGSAKSFIYPIFRLTGCQLINWNVHLNMTLELSGLRIVALAKGNAKSNGTSKIESVFCTFSVNLLWDFSNT